MALFQLRRQCWRVKCEPVSKTISGFKAPQWLDLPRAELDGTVSDPLSNSLSTLGFPILIALLELHQH